MLRGCFLIVLLSSFLFGSAARAANISIPVNEASDGPAIIVLDGAFVSEDVEKF
jgi:hypothetical protein